MHDKIEKSEGRSVRRGQQRLHFLSGLPRSGSTLLGAILSQHPDVYVSPTSPLAELMSHTELFWSSRPETKASAHPDQIFNIYRGLARSTYEHIDKPVVLDKGRGWPGNIGAIQKIFGRPKIVTTVRDMPDVLASFIAINNRTTEVRTFIDAALMDKRVPLTNENRCQYLTENVVGGSYNALKIGYHSLPECFYFVEYEDLISNPENILKGVLEYLEVSPFSFDLEAIENTLAEKDEYWGMPGLHDIRPKIGKTARPPEEILGRSLWRKYAAMNLEFWKRIDGPNLSNMMMNQLR